LNVRNLVDLFALLLAGIACVSDLRTRRIPNSIVLAGFGAGLIFNGLVAGVPGVGSSLAGGAIGLALFLPFFALGGMGGGDVKLLAALGSLVGPRDIVGLALAAAIAGGFFALIVAARNGRVREILRSTGRLLAFWARSGLLPSPEQTLENPAALRLPYAVPMLLGTLLVALGRARW